MPEAETVAADLGCTVAQATDVLTRFVALVLQDLGPIDVEAAEAMRRLSA